MKRSRERGSRSRTAEENLRSKVKEFEKQIRQLRRYVRQLETRIGIDGDSEEFEEPDKATVSIDEETHEVCPECASPNVVFVKTFKIDKPITIRICKDCKVKAII